MECMLCGIFCWLDSFFNYVLNERRKSKPGLSGWKVGSQWIPSLLTNTPLGFERGDTLPLPLSHLMTFTDLIGMEQR